MTTYIGLLRAANLGSHKKVAMADLRALLVDLGLENPRTLLNSGNVVFGNRGKTAAQLERLLEREAERRLGLATEWFVRSPAEWRRTIAANPFPAEARSDPSRLLVSFMKKAPTASAVTALRAAISGRERVDVKGREAFIVYPEGIGRSKLTGALIERTLGLAGTARNWNTVQKLAALADGA